jgi:hypothetical protein
VPRLIVSSVFLARRDLARRRLFPVGSFWSSGLDNSFLGNETGGAGNFFGRHFKAEIRDLAFVGRVADQIIDSTSFDSRNNDLVLAPEQLSYCFLGSTLPNLLSIGCPFLSYDRTAYIHEGFEKRVFLPAVLSLYVINAASMLNISIEAGDHILIRKLAQGPVTVNNW